ncbi:hypothetical protein BDW62DRAFT_187686 [Aspergillus aurantiobrunneus]
MPFSTWDATTSQGHISAIAATRSPACKDQGTGAGTALRQPHRPSLRVLGGRIWRQPGRSQRSPVHHILPDIARFKAFSSLQVLAGVYRELLLHRCSYLDTSDVPRAHVTQAARHAFSLSPESLSALASPIRRKQILTVELPRLQGIPTICEGQGLKMFQQGHSQGPCELQRRFCRPPRLERRSDPAPQLLLVEPRRTHGMTPCSTRSRRHLMNR